MSGKMKLSSAQSSLRLFWRVSSAQVKSYVERGACQQESVQGANFFELLGKLAIKVLEAMPFVNHKVFPGEALDSKLWQLLKITWKKDRSLMATS